jgi:hypothetical protein
MMKLNVHKALAELQRMPVADLRRKFEEVWKEPCRSSNKPFLIKRIIWQMQALEEGSLSERALRRAAEIVRESDLRLSPPRPKPVAANGETVTLPMRTGGMPMPGTVLTRRYKARLLQVTVLDDGFEFEGEHYKSLSAIARHITGTQWNGHLFFGLKKSRGAR